MNRIFCIMVLMLAGALAGAAEGPATLFPMPVAPESLPIGRPRANYIVEHYWDKMPWKLAHTMPAKMEQTLRDFADILPLAAADTVHLALDRLIAAAAKKPDCFKALMPMAEATFYADTALLRSDEVYLPFARAAAKHKKLTQNQRNHYAAQARVIESSSEGRTVPALKARLRDGGEIALNDTSKHAATYVFIFETPGGETFERVRFAANYAVRALAEANGLMPVLLYAGKAPEQWWSSVANFPGITAEMPDAADYFDLRGNPAVYVTDGNMTVVSKLMPLSALTANCERLLQSLK